jgi:hypothetical protein
VKTREINGLGKVKKVKFMGGKIEQEETERKEEELVGVKCGTPAETRVRGIAAERCSAADWPSEGIGIEGSMVSTLLFELGSNDHEFRFVIMG